MEGEMDIQEILQYFIDLLQKDDQRVKTQYQNIMRNFDIHQ